jgi:hypothetical protein
MREGADGHKPVKVKLGAVNDTHAQIVEGVKKGDQVLLLQAGQGRELLEKAGIKIAPATRPSVVDEMPPLPVDRGPANGGNGGASRGQGMSNGSGGGDTPTTNPSGTGANGSSRRRRSSSSGGDGSSGGGGGGGQRPPAAVTPAPAS